MTTDVRLLVYSAILTWVMLVVASSMRSRSWTSRGMRVAFGNRENVPEASPAAARADRAARNMLENMILFVAVLVAAHRAGASQESLDLGARLFFYSRVSYFLVYLAGISYIRTLFWLSGMVGVGVIAAAAL
jgi:uncharacterized MAPEG superfamily protein